MASFKHDKEFIRNIILDHYENPKYRAESKPKKTSDYLFGFKDSPSCIDNLSAYVLVKNNKITDIKFSGIGCAIATSSTDIMANEIIGKTPAEAKIIINNYFAMLDEKEHEESLLNELFVFENVNKQINRIKCAKVGIQAIEQALNKYEAK